jgi:hypothetical protein
MVVFAAHTIAATISCLKSKGLRIKNVNIGWKIRSV